MILTALVLGTPSPSSADGAAEEAVRQALSAGEYPWYDEDADAPNYDLLLGELEEPEFDERGTEWVAWLLNALAAAILIGVLVFLVRRMLEARRTQPLVPVEEKPASAPIVPFEDPELGHDPDAWLASSRALADEGDYAGAIVHLFNHELLELDRAHRIRLGPGRTNRHHLAELGDSGRGRLLFRSTMRTFEAIYYGGRSADREAYERFAEEQRRLLRGGGDDAGSAS